MSGGIIILRVISGSAKGHQLKTVKGNATRPTADRVKEALFNILAPFIAGSEILDLFAGTGSLGIEALSRGAESASFVDKSSECCRIIRGNLVRTKLSDRGTIYLENCSSALARFAAGNRKFDIILLDPPYNKNFIQETLKILTENDIISYGGILAAEHHIDDDLPDNAGILKKTDRRVYGDTSLSLYTAGER